MIEDIFQCVDYTRRDLVGGCTFSGVQACQKWEILERCLTWYCLSVSGGEPPTLGEVLSASGSP